MNGIVRISPFWLSVAITAALLGCRDRLRDPVKVDLDSKTELANPVKENEVKKELVTKLAPAEVIGLVEQDSSAARTLVPQEQLSAGQQESADNSTLDALRRLEVSVDKDGTPIVGYEFKSKSETARRADQRRQERDLAAEAPGTVLEFGSDGRQIEDN